MDSLLPPFEDPEIRETTEQGHQQSDESRAVLLLSSGLDSTSLFCLATDYYDEIQPIFFRYGNLAQDVEERQSHNLVEWVQANVDGCDVQDLMVVDLQEQFSQLIDSPTTVSGHDVDEHEHTVGYVPMRNLIFISLASSFATNHGYRDVLIGDSLGDFMTGTPVSNPTALVRGTYTYLISQVTQIASSKGDVVVRAPLIDARITYAESAQLLSERGWPLEFSYSCFEVSDPDNPEPCGECSTCQDRIGAFEDAGCIDPLLMGEDE